MGESPDMSKKKRIWKSRLAIALAAAALLAGALPAAAQSVEGRGDRRAARMEHRLTRLTQELNLDARQVASLRQLFEQARAERAAARAQGMQRGTPEAREARRAHRERMSARIGQILNAQQRARWEQMKQERHERRGDCRDGRGHRGRGHGGHDRRGTPDA
jgi:hypothetical protein